jgi:hypothetical protein
VRRRGLSILFVLTLALVAAALVQAFRVELFVIQEQSSSQSIERTFARVEAALAHFRGAQAGYVAPGQNPDVWMKRASDLTAGVIDQVSALQTATRSDDARVHYDGASAALAAVADLDRKVRADLSDGEQRLASEVIFMDELEAARRLDAELAAARDAELSASQARIADFRRWQLGLIGGAFGVLTIVALVLLGHVPAARQADQLTPAAEPVTPGRMIPPPPISATARPVAPPSTAARPAVPAAARPAPSPAAGARLPPAAPAAATSISQPATAAPTRAARTSASLSEAADVCVDLARVLDVRDVPPLLARAAGALNASGLVLWITNSERTMLNPSLSHGYPEKVLKRLGTLTVDADNPTSLAFRSMSTQVIGGRSPGAHGAIAVPLVTATGCLGVLAAEVQLSQPGDETHAIARMVAAQLATLLSPVADGTAQKTATA